MKKLLGLWFIVFAVFFMSTGFVACSSVPKCDNDACYNRRLASEQQSGQDAQEEDEDSWHNFHGDTYRRE